MCSCLTLKIPLQRLTLMDRKETSQIINAAYPLGLNTRNPGDHSRFFRQFLKLRVCVDNGIKTQGN